MELKQLTNGRLLAIASSCIALNLVAGKVANVLSLPVYLDSIGTILSAALVPPILSIAVGALTSLLAWVIIHPAYLFYVGTQITIALVSILAVRCGAFRNLWTAVIAGLGIAVTSAVVSAPVTVMVFGGVTVPGTTAINAVLIAAGHNIWRAVIEGSLLVESIDKIGAAIIAWLVLTRLPNRIGTNV